MATETTSQNDLSEQVVISGKIAKNRRCKNSKCSKLKEKKRSAEKPLLSSSFSESESEDEDRKGHTAAGRVAQKLPAPTASNEERSGYSSSDETSEDESDIYQTMKEKINKQNREVAAAEQEQQHQQEQNKNELRKRKITAENDGKFMVTGANAENTVNEEPNTQLVRISPSSFDYCDKTDTGEWEMVDKCPKESDISVTSESETSTDDFWKSDSQIRLLTKEKTAKKRKKDKSSVVKKISKPERVGIFRRCRNEWKWLKEEYYEEMRELKNIRNKCLIEFLIIFIYCGIGGIIFHNTEGAFEMFYKCGVKRVKRDFLDSLWSKSHYMREEEWKSTARNKLMEFENQLYDAYEAGMTSYSGQKGWSFINSLVYSVTLVTTIGYGHLAPKTTVGRIITIVYSLFGIPMFLILLADYGKLFTRGIKFLWAFVRRLYYTGSCRKVRRTAPVQEMVKGVQLVFDMTKLRRPSQMPKDGNEPPFPCPTSPTGTPALSAYTIDDEFNLPVSVAVSILIMYMLAGAVFISLEEEWPLFDSFYFVYISILTIGLGDLVLTSHVFLLSLVYLVFGLALTSMCINVVQEKLTDSFRQATAKIGATMGLEVTSEEAAAMNVAVIPENQTEEEQE